MLRPAKLALKALNVQPDGPDTALENTVCSMCGFPICKGEKVKNHPMKKQPNFMDEISMAAKGTEVACGWCTPMLKKPLMMKSMATVFTQDGAYPILNDRNRTWFLLSPPEPPYLAVVGDTKLQHLVWRTPVTLDNELMTVRFGAKIFTIRHSRLMRSVELCTEAGLMLQKDSDKKTPYSHPFLQLDRNLKSLDNGRLHPRAVELARGDKRMFEILDYLKKNSLGELWALATLAKRKKETSTKPDPITI